MDKHLVLVRFIQTTILQNSHMQTLQTVRNAFACVLNVWKSVGISMLIVKCCLIISSAVVEVYDSTLEDTNFVACLNA